MKLIESILASPRMQAAEQALGQSSSLLMEELWNAPKALIAALAQQATNKHILILTGASQEEIRLYHDLAFFADRPVIDFPSWETLPSENIAPSPDIVGDRYEALKQIQASKEPYIILTGLQACLQRLIMPSTFAQLHLSLEQGQTFPFEELIQRFIEHPQSCVSSRSCLNAFLNQEPLNLLRCWWFTLGLARIPALRADGYITTLVHLGFSFAVYALGHNKMPPYGPYAR